MGINKNNGSKFLEVREGIIGKTLSILDSALLTTPINDFHSKFHLYVEIKRR